MLNSLPDYGTAQTLVQTLRRKHIPRDVATYTILVKKAPDVAEAKNVLRQMTEDGFSPNEVTYNTLVNKTDDYAEAARLVAEMKAAGIAPNQFTYSSLFSKEPPIQAAREILDWYYQQAYHGSNPLNGLIASFRKGERIDDALEIALEHPHLSSAQSLMKDYPVQAKARFQEAKRTTTEHPTADFALGALYRVTGDVESARLHLQKALSAAQHPNQKRTIQNWLQELPGV